MQKRSLSNDELGTLFFLAALIFGAWFRIAPPLTAGFPINDGGLFYVNIRSLQNNQYRLPEYIQYNGLNIPFAYPPFAFYLSGGITEVLNIDLLQTMRWLPAIVLIISIPAIFFLANLFLKSRLQAGITVFLYAMMPRSITWMIMGGGITRSLGQLFYIAAAIQIYLLFTQNNKQNVLFAILFSTLVCLTHPEAAIHTVTAAMVLWILHGRNRSGTLKSVLVALGTLVLASPWWLTILFRFGLGPFQSAARTSFHNISNLLLPFTLFSEERFIPLIAPLAILGIGVLIAKREFLLPTLYFVPLYFEPRFAFNISIIPMACLASVALCELILPGLAGIEGRLRNVEFNGVLQSRSSQFLLFVILVCLMFGMQSAETEYSANRVSIDVRQAFEWIRSHTQPDDKLLILTGVEGVLDDPVNEWSPVLTERQSVTTAQGMEWLGGNLFVNKLVVIHNIQQCRNEIDPLKCADAIASNMAIEYDYVIFTLSDQQYDFGMESDVDGFPGFQVVYLSTEVLILKKTLPGITLK